MFPSIYCDFLVEQSGLASVSLGVCRTSIRALLVFRVSLEKPGVNKRDLPFPLAALNTLFSVYAVFRLCAKGTFSSGLIYLVFCVLLYFDRHLIL